MNRLFVRPILFALCGAFLCIGMNVSANEAMTFPEVTTIEQDLKQDSVESFSEMFSENLGYSNDSHYLQRIHSDGYYHLVSYSDTGDVIQLHDASKWEIQRNGRQKVLYWVQSDDIFIKPVASCFSFYKYVLQNRTTNQVVEANLINPPLPMGANTFRIVNIQPYERLVLLSDNTVWKVASDSNFAYWQIGQRLIVGVNNKWRTASSPHILINVDISGHPYSEAMFYGYPVGK